MLKIGMERSIKTNEESVELYQLTSFLEVARCQNLTRAARSLHISQSALSSQIKLLEEELGFPLFSRSSRGMVPTERGRVIESYAAGVITSANQLVSKAREIKGEGLGTVKLGMNTDGGFLKVSKLSRQLTTQHPGIHFVFVSSQTILTPEMLREGIIDIGFFFGEQSARDLVCRHLAQVDIAIVIPRKIYAEAGPLGWPELCELPWIWSQSNCPYYQVVQARLDEMDLKPNKFLDAMDETVVKELVLDGQGVAVMRHDDAHAVCEQGAGTIWQEGGFEVPLHLGRLRSAQGQPVLDTVTEAIVALWRG